MSRNVAIVTGASRGIGAATVCMLAESDYAVVVSYRSRSDAAERVASSIRERGGECAVVQADISDEQQVLRLFRTVDEKFGRLDALVNNAGILQRQCAVRDLTTDRLNRVFAVNVIGTFLCCREAAKRLKTGGAIVNVSSIAAKLGAPNEYVDYAASKGAIDSLTIGLAKELASQNIRVNAVRPGIIDTDIHADGGEPGRVERVGPGLPLGRAGTVQDVAEAICWLLSDKSAFTTGQLIDIAGGL